MLHSGNLIHDKIAEGIGVTNSSQTVSYSWVFDVRCHGLEILFRDGRCPKQKTLCYEVTEWNEKERVNSDPFLCQPVPPKIFFFFSCLRLKFLTVTFFDVILLKIPLTAQKFSNTLYIRLHGPLDIVDLYGETFYDCICVPEMTQISLYQIFNINVSASMKSFDNLTCKCY